MLILLSKDKNLKKKIHINVYSDFWDTLYIFRIYETKIWGLWFGS